MKKILALLLTAVMVFGILPVAALAAEPIEIYADTYAGSSSVTLPGSNDYKIMEDETVVIDEGDTWTVCEGCTLYVYGKLEIKGTLIVEGYVTAIDNGEVLARCWTDDEGATYKTCTIRNSKRICNNESEQVKRYFAEVHVPAIVPDALFGDPAHKLVVDYKCSFSGSEYDFLKTEYADGSPYDFADVFSSTYFNGTTGILKVPLNQYLFLRFSFLENGAASKKYDGNRMAIRFNKIGVKSEQGVCAQFIDCSGTVAYYPAELVNISGASFNVWKDSYFLRQERIYIPSGNGYSTFGVNGEISANDQTVRLNYGDEFKFRVTIDPKYSDSAYAVYLVQSYQWNERNHEDSLESLLDEVYVDEFGNPQHFVWKFEEEKAGEEQKVYIDQYGVYHIASVDDEYTIVVSGVVSNDTLSIAGNLMDTLRNLINAIKQFFERIMQMFGR